MEKGTPSSGKCVKCGVECNKFCSNCKKVYYCCTDHQRWDRKGHKKSCFPAQLSFDGVQGRHFRATRNISKGEKIFAEKALVVGPSGAEKYFHPICLGCYRVVRTDYCCSNCGWPVCNASCEKLTAHRDCECEIFARRKIEPYFTKPYEYDFIKFLRSILLLVEGGENNNNEKNNDKKWEQILQLASHAEARKECEASILATMSSYEFITDTCGLTHIDYDTVDHVVGVWGVNSFGANAPSGPNPTGRIASFLFPKTSLCSHNCVANTRGILLEEEEEIKNGKNVIKKPVFSMELLASLPIREGEEILITYAEVGEGTFERRKVLQENYYFPCTCHRCQDPTEFNTFLSGVKCPNCPNDRRGGYLLPENPLDFDTDWICYLSRTEEGTKNDFCKTRKKYYELVGPLLKIKQDLNTIGSGREGGGGAEVEIENFERILRENSGKTLHPNHWILMETQYRLVQRLICHMPEAKNVFNVLKKCISLSQHCLEVADAIRPGYNSYRGKLLYCLCQAKLQEIVRSSSSGSADLVEKRTNLFQLKARVDEAKEILIKEPIGSDERFIAESLKEDIKQIQRIITVLDNKLRNGV